LIKTMRLQQQRTFTHNNRKVAKCNPKGAACKDMNAVAGLRFL
jgi:hypothetical protein